MLRSLLAAMVTACLLSTGLVIAATPAQADTPRCVTKVEYKRVHKGNRIQRAHRVFDARGRFLDGGAGGFARGYRFCAGARRKADARRFVIIYATRIRDSRLISTRVNTKYCGPSYTQRRHCF